MYTWELPTIPTTYSESRCPSIVATSTHPSPRLIATPNTPSPLHLSIIILSMGYVYQCQVRLSRTSVCSVYTFNSADSHLCYSLVDGLMTPPTGTSPTRNRRLLSTDKENPTSQSARTINENVSVVSHQLPHELGVWMCQEYAEGLGCHGQV